MRDTEFSANERAWVDMKFLSCMTGRCTWRGLCFPAVVEAEHRRMTAEKGTIFLNE
jgi:hypothetical protein